MAGTFTQIYIQVVFAVKGRHNLVQKERKDDLRKCIAGIIKGKSQKSISVNGMPDHIHAFVGLKPAMAVSDLVRDIKNNSTSFINDRKLVKRKFSWQDGYGSFSYGHSQIDKVYKYVLRQEQHHRKKHFVKSTWTSLKNLKCPTMKNICLNGQSDHDTPSGLSWIQIHFL